MTLLFHLLRSNINFRGAKLTCLLPMEYFLLLCCIFILNILFLFARSMLTHDIMLWQLLELLFDLIFDQALDLILDFISHEILLGFKQFHDLLIYIFLYPLRQTFCLILNFSFDLFGHLSHDFLPEFRNSQEHNGKRMLIGWKTFSELLIFHIWFLNLLKVHHSLKQLFHKLRRRLLLFLWILFSEHLLKVFDAK